MTIDLVGVGGGDLVVGGDGVGLVRAVERALRAGDVGADDGRAQVLQREAVGGEPRQIGLDADRRADAALHRDVADAGHLGQPLRHHGVGQIAEAAQVDGLRGERQRDDRRVGRVHLRIERRVGQVARQRRAGGVDRRLHVLRGGVDVAVEIELQRDLADAERTRRGHRLQRRDLAELALQRRGDQRGDGVGIGAGQLRRDLDGREIDLRQRRDRQPPVAERAAQHHRDAEQRGGDRPVDEWGGDAHCCVRSASRRRSAGRCAAARLARAGGAGAPLGAADRDLAAVGEPHEAGGDHALGRRRRRFSTTVCVSSCFCTVDRAHRHGVVVLDHVDEGAVRAALHRAGRDHHHVFAACRSAAAH